jgi:serine/threonine protein kinase
MDLLINKIYKITKKLGSGGFSEIFLATNLLTNEDVAVKLEDTDAEDCLLLEEAKIYQQLFSDKNVAMIGIPKTHYSETEGRYDVLVMDLLGSSLEDLLDMCGRRFSLKTVLMLADQILQRIEFIHFKGVIHKDIKPGNFLMGLGEKQSNVYLIDFGLAQRYIKDTNHIQYTENNVVSGTSRYMSVNSHMGIQPSRRDDLESLCYTLIYLLRGNLPWENADNYQKLREEQLSTPLDELCKGLPEEFLTVLIYCRRLRFEDKPDYGYLRNLFQDLFTKSGYTLDFQFDWNITDQEFKKNKNVNPLDTAATLSLASISKDNSDQTKEEENLTMIK